MVDEVSTITTRAEHKVRSAPLVCRLYKYFFLLWKNLFKKSERRRSRRSKFDGGGDGRGGAGREKLFLFTTDVHHLHLIVCDAFHHISVGQFTSKWKTSIRIYKLKIKKIQLFGLDQFSNFFFQIPEFVGLTNDLTTLVSWLVKIYIHIPDQ